MTRKFSGLSALIAVVVAAACNDVKLAPDVPASIEFRPFPAAAIAIGDTLRDQDGVAVPARVAVLNQDGDTLRDAPVRFTYLDTNNDTALVVDSVTGYIVARKALTNASTARIAARVGASLQVIRQIAVTSSPDTVDRGTEAAPAPFTVVVPDTSATQNTSPALSVSVRHAGTATPVTYTAVAGWLVKFALISPANPNNDSTRSVFLVNDARRASNIDTTDASGIASRSVRIRSASFPSGSNSDTAVVEVTVTYRGAPVKGSPVVIKLPVVRAAPTP
ncbi:MAG: hypothetical protein ACO1Q7_09275 [Gemmatimonas sp.]